MRTHQDAKQRDKRGIRTQNTCSKRHPHKPPLFQQRHLAFRPSALRANGQDWNPPLRKTWPWRFFVSRTPFNGVWVRYDPHVLPVERRIKLEFEETHEVFSDVNGGHLGRPGLLEAIYQ